MLHNVQIDSETALLQDLYKLSDAGASVIQVRTREPIRAATILRKSMLTEYGYREWDVVNGMRNFTIENYTDNTGVKGDAKGFVEALSAPLEELRKTGSAINSDKNKLHYFVYIDPQPFLRDNAYTASLLTQYAAILPSHNVCIVLVTPEVTIDSVAPGTLLVTDMRTPNAAELEAVLRRLITHSARDYPDGCSMTDDDYAQVAQMGLGLTLYEFETYAALAIIGNNMGPEDQRPQELTMDMMLNGIAVGKTEVIKQSEVLELYPTISMDEVGGMQRLKDWIEHRRACFTDEARDFGIEPPKGIVVAGVPGTGKSLVAKAIASALGIPLVRLDMGRVFSKYIGDSEGRMRSALKMVEAMAPCVLFSDEIDKGLGGAGGGGDSGTSSRVLGTFLTWLNDCKAPVFNMVTANRVQGLPPELLRKGRFDQIFATLLPSREERREILRIHLTKRGHEATFDKQQWARFMEHSDGYVPAEIESAVKDALILAFNSGEAVGMEHIIEALRAMVPMSRSDATRIQAIIDWAQNNAISVNYDPVTALAEAQDDQAEPAAAGGATRARRITRRG